MSAELAEAIKVLAKVGGSKVNSKQGFNINKMFNFEIGTTRNYDIFGDGSCVGLHTFETVASEVGTELVHHSGGAINIVDDSGKFGNSLLFASNVISGITEEPIMYRDFSYSFWAKPTATQPVLSAGITAWQQGQRYYQYPAWVDSPYATGACAVGTNCIQFIGHGSSYVYSLLSYEITTIDWTHIVVNMTDNIPSLYVNGVYIKEGISSSRTIQSSTLLGINDSNFGYSAGYIDQHRIFNRPLTQDEVTTLYNEIQIDDITIPYKGGA